MTALDVPVVARPSTAAPGRGEAPDAGLPLPPGSIVLHIGPHKTGTTSVQAAFHGAREASVRQSVQYAGANRQPVHAAQAAVARGTDREARRPPGPWLDLVREIRSSRADRILVSSEFLCDARPPAIEAIARDLGPDRVHVAVTLRPLAAVLPSQWQQYAQGAEPLTFEAFLEDVLGAPPGPMASRVWHRHRHDELVERWASVVGRDHVTVIVADDRDRDAVLRAFERLVGLRQGTLVAPDDRVNRSLTQPEIELVRRLNSSLAAWGVDARLRQDVVLFGAAQVLKRRIPPDDEVRIRTPDWAAEQIAQIARDIAASLRTAGVRVIGDLERLTGWKEGPAGSQSQWNGAGWPEIAAASSMGVLLATGHARGRPRRGESGWDDGVEVSAASSVGRLSELPGSDDDPVDLATVSIQRLRKALTTRLKRSVRPQRRRRRAIHSATEVE